MERFYEYITEHTKYANQRLERHFPDFRLSKIIDGFDKGEKCIRFKLCGTRYGWRTDYNSDLDYESQHEKDCFRHIDSMTPNEIRNVLCFLYLEFRDKYNEQVKEIEKLNEEKVQYEYIIRRRTQQILELRKELSEIKKRRANAGRKNKSGEKKDEILTLSKQGLSCREIGVKVGLSKSVVHKIINGQKDEK